jgi:phage terminase Nu1 subunit (DNA packaging protein)
MADGTTKKYKFCQIDPNNCTVEELEEEVERLKNLGDFYETKQLALKKYSQPPLRCGCKSSEKKKEKDCDNGKPLQGGLREPRARERWRLRRARGD